MNYAFKQQDRVYALDKYGTLINLNETYIDHRHRSNFFPLLIFLCLCKEPFHLKGVQQFQTKKTEKNILLCLSGVIFPLQRMLL